MVRARKCSKTESTRKRLKFDKCVKSDRSDISVKESTNITHIKNITHSTEKTDCFAYKPRECAALLKRNCDGCKFYKTMELLETERQRAIERVFTLDEKSRNKIINVYFGGDVNGRL